jgi:hypothetical protein
VQRPPRGGAHGGRFSKNLLHPRIGLERLSFHDANRSQLSHDLGIEGVARLVLNECIQLLVDVKSLAGIVLNAAPLPSMNLFTGGVMRPGWTLPSRSIAMLVP